MLSQAQQNSNIYCPLPSHQDQQCFAICIEDSCPKQGLLCFKCLLTYHQAHLNSCIPLNEFTKLMRENANNVKIGCIGNISPISDLQKEQLSRLDKIKEELASIKNAIIDKMDKFLQEQAEKVRVKIKSLQNISNFTILEKNYQKLQYTDQLTYQELTLLFDFFRPLIEKDRQSNSFNFICTEPNFDIIHMANNQDIDQQLHQVQKNLFKFNQI